MSPPFLPSHLLVISPQESVVQWIHSYLDSQFFILSASTETQALKFIESCFIDLIILDEQVSNALSFCQRLRNQMANNSLPILLITGRLKKSFLEQALQAGVSDFLSSQLDLQELEARIQVAKATQKARDKTATLAAQLAASSKTPSISFLQKRFLLHDQALRILTEAKLHGISVDFLLIKLDRFDDIQEEYGFLAANELFVKLATYLNDQVGDTNFLFPAREDTLILLIPGSSGSDVSLLAQTLSKQVATIRFAIADTTLSLSISIVFGQGSNLDQIVRVANKALVPSQLKQIIPLSSEPL
jgi:two-component system cell cycle response regulator